MEKVHKIEKTELFNEKMMEAPLKCLQSYSPSQFSSDVLIVGCVLYIKNINIFFKGLPGSGKTHLIRRFQSHSQHFIIIYRNSRSEWGDLI